MIGEAAWLERHGATPPDPGERERLRATLGIPLDTAAVAPLLDDATPIDARRAVFLAGVVDLLGQPCSLVLPRRASRQAEAERFLFATGVGVRIIVVEPPLVRLWPALDVVFEIDHALRRLDGGPTMRAFRAWAEACRVALRVCEPREAAPGPIPPLADTLWWAGELPGRLL